MVDANMKWSADQAIRAARAFAPFNLLWLEEPTIPDDVAGHVRVVREGLTPVASGENMHTLYEFSTLMAAGGLTYPEPDVTNCGGVTIFRKIGAVAEAHNLPLTSHGAHDITVHLLAAAPNRTYMEVHGFSMDRFLAEPMPVVDGFTVAPERPGHGIELDWAALEPHRV
jgi:L-alanine-DL-glutamate epimerase-like enolase superfamily enzyme